MEKNSELLKRENVCTLHVTQVSKRQNFYTVLYNNADEFDEVSLVHSLCI